ncbi:MAG TPA: glutathione S-transferase family protein [Solirubrobacterales bacterium]|nr:glutathione S-transferase family protein [Solirubrobacterales bacterium]
MSDALPTLWQIDVSHYSEKARWALAWKGVEHRRRSPVPGAHMAVALWLTRGAQYTFPVLSIDGERIGDSTAIIAALEERYPHPALYPADIAQRLRALELEEFFDEELGPQIRQLAWYEFGNDRESFAKLMEQTAPAPLAKFGRPTAAYARAYTALRFRAGNAEEAERARVKVLAALDRLEAELGDGEYLVGDSFSVADLTAASLFYPLASPEEGPLRADSPAAKGFEVFREPLNERRGVEWVREMFRRHRKPAKTAAATPMPS